MPVVNMWGGTAGSWNKKALDLDEFEIMVVARKNGDPVSLPAV